MSFACRYNVLRLKPCSLVLKSSCIFLDLSLRGMPLITVQREVVQAFRHGGKSVRFSPQEEKWLREGYALFSAKFGEGGRGRNGGQSWYQRTLERFAFHPSRTHQSLRQKWQVMGGKK